MQTLKLFYVPLMEKYDVLIIGSGLSGLSCATQLQQGGKKVCVLDKGYQPGGRTASKSLETPLGKAIFDYGAQYFTVEELEFQKQVVQWQKAGIVQKWALQFASTSPAEHRTNRTRYRGVPTMRSLCTHMAESLIVKQQQKVIRINDLGGFGWEVETQQGNRFQADILVNSAPLAQSLELCYYSGVIPVDRTVTFFNQQKYHSCIALMIASDSDSQIPEPGGLWFDDLSPIRWASDNKKKGISEITAVTFHLSPSFSKEHYEEQESQLLAFLYDELKKWVPGKWIKTAVHRWRYSQPTNIVDISYMRDDYYTNLWFTGDVFLNGRVESAWMAGWNTANAILKS